MRGTRSEFNLGWKPLFAALLGTMCGASPVPFNTVGSFLMPLQADYHWNPGQVMTGITIYGVVACLLAPFFGHMSDRFGTRRVGIFSLIAFGLVFAAFGLTPRSLPVFYSLWFLLGLIAIGSTPVTWSRVVNSWFIANRGFALGIMLVGTGAAAFVLPSLATFLIDTVGWRWAFALLALLPLALALPAVIAFLREPTKAEMISHPLLAENLLGVTVREGLGSYRFWIMWVAFFVIALAYGGFQTNLQNMMVLKGFTKPDAALVAGFTGLAIIVGRVGAGLLMDRFWAPLITLPLLSLPVISCLIYASHHLTFSHAVVGASLLGLAAGAESDLVAYLVGRYFGMANYGSLYGLLYMAFGFGSAFSPMLYGYSEVAAGSYTPILRIAAVMFLSGALMLLLLGRYPVFKKISLDRGGDDAAFRPSDEPLSQAD